MDKSKILSKLNELLEIELSGVPRYLHYSLMITGPNRIPIVKFFKDQANEAFAHASILGEKITAFGGHPSIKVKPVPETNRHNVLDILDESLTFEKEALSKYYDILPLCTEDVALDELIRGLIQQEQEHVEEVEKMLKVTKSDKNDK